ncbi:MAG: DUF1800 domain-containing protein [Planctomycetota bacterium]
MSSRTKLPLRPLAALLAATLILPACGPGGSTQANGLSTPTPLPITEADATRFLARASFGATGAASSELRALGYARWIERQQGLPVTELLPGLLELGCSFVVDPDCEEDNIDPHIDLLNRLWWGHAVYADDQLRQRVAFALSEIFVVSFFNAELAEYPTMLADYYDALARGAFGNYRDLLETITLHPAMGIYLSMIRNRKEDPVAGTRPDENYAREVMQLFSIGLVRLDANGQPLLDPLSGATVPTYDQHDITELARVFTGWTFASEETPSASLDAFTGLAPSVLPMQAWPAFHDDGAKLILDDVFVPAGLNPADELDLALDALANHPNVGPFLSRQLIQRLVTSNPSPAYIGRVAAVWADDGAGQRGNLAAVVCAILLDGEALASGSDPSFGKVREPVQRVTALWRAFDGELLPGSDAFGGFDAQENLGQQALYSPSVFNFFSPSYATTALAQQGLVGPELQIMTHATLTSQSGFLTELVFEGNSAVVEAGSEWGLPVLQVGELQSLAGNVPALLSHLDTHLLGGTLSGPTRDALAAYLEGIDLASGDPGVPDGLERALIALATLIDTPDYLVQK